MTLDRFATVDRLPARVGAPTPLGALVPTVSGGALMLVGEGATETEFPFGANVASLLILDLDAGHTVGSVETLLPLDDWEPTDASLAPPDRTQPGSLQIEGPAITLETPDAEPRFLVNGDEGRLLIELGEYSPETEWIRLSDRCHALVDAGSLAGFAIRLGD
jgi:hypothetical protein